MSELVKYNTDPLSLSNISDGAAIERFDHVIKKMIADIKDPNTEATDVRKVTLTLAIKPDEDRERLAIGFNVSGTVGKMKPVLSTGEIIIGKGGYVIAERLRHKQLELSNVVELKKSEEGGE